MRWCPLQLPLYSVLVNTAFKRFLLIAGFAVAGVAAASAEDKASAATEKAKVSSAAEVDKAKEQLKKQSEAMLSERQKLIEQLKGASEEQRKSILEKLHQQQKDFIEAVRELGKQQRDEQRRLRESSGKTGGR